MCPVCLSSVALIAAGAGSTGGLTALILRKLRGGAKNPEPEPRAVPEPKENPR